MFEIANCAHHHHHRRHHHQHHSFGDVKSCLIGQQQQGHSTRSYQCTLGVGVAGCSSDSATDPATSDSNLHSGGTTGMRIPLQSNGISSTSPVSPLPPTPSASPSSTSPMSSATPHTPCSACPQVASTTTCGTSPIVTSSTHVQVKLEETGLGLLGNGGHVTATSAGCAMSSQGAALVCPPDEWGNNGSLGGASAINGCAYRVSCSAVAAPGVGGTTGANINVEFTGVGSAPSGGSSVTASSGIGVVRSAACSPSHLHRHHFRHHHHLHVHHHPLNDDEHGSSPPIDHSCGPGLGVGTTPSTYHHHHHHGVLSSGGGVGGGSGARRGSSCSEAMTTSSTPSVYLSVSAALVSAASPPSTKPSPPPPPLPVAAMGCASLSHVAAVNRGAPDACVFVADRYHGPSAFSNVTSCFGGSGGGSASTVGNNSAGFNGFFSSSASTAPSPPQSATSSSPQPPSHGKSCTETTSISPHAAPSRSSCVARTSSTTSNHNDKQRHSHSYSTSGKNLPFIPSVPRVLYNKHVIRA